MNTPGALSFSGLIIRNWYAFFALTYTWFRRSPQSFAMFMSWWLAMERRNRG